SLVELTGHVPGSPINWACSSGSRSSREATILKHHWPGVVSVGSRAVIMFFSSQTRKRASGTVIDRLGVPEFHHEGCRIDSFRAPSLRAKPGDIPDDHAANAAHRHVARSALRKTDANAVGFSPDAVHCTALSANSIPRPRNAP